MDRRKDLQHDQVLKVPKQNIDTAIISQMAEDGKKMKKSIEKILGYQVDEQRYEKAYKYAKHKLDWQSRHFNKDYSNKYLAIVVAETYEQQIFADYINTTSMRRVQA